MTPYLAARGRRPVLPPPLHATVTLRYQSLYSLAPAYLQFMSSHHFSFNFLGSL